MSKLETFIQRHRNALIFGAIAVGVTGAALYYGYGPGAQPDSGALSPDSPTGQRSRSKKSKSKKRKGKTSQATNLTSHGFPVERVPVSQGPYYPVIEDAVQTKHLPEKERKEIADELKMAGNSAFNSQMNQLALELYTKAIEVYDKDATYYSNRAAVQGILMDYDSVVKDTTRALELCPDYVKCFSRRGAAYEKLGNYQDSILDFTAACIFSNFEDQALGKSVDRVLRLQAEKVVSEKYGDGLPSHEFPSPSFITAYLQSFHKRQLPREVVEAQEGTGEYDLKLAFDAMEKENTESYKQAIAYIKSSLEKGLSQSAPEVEALALEYKATFEFLLNDAAGAMKDINLSIEKFPTVQALIKRSSLHLDFGDLDAVNDDFARAAELNQNSADVYYQLAQMSFLQQEWDKAIVNYKKSIDLDDDFLLAHIQLAVARYRKGDHETARADFLKLISKYPNNSHVHNYYGEVLLDMKEVAAASAEFDKAIKLELSKATAAINVVPLINKALATVTNFQNEGAGSDLQKAVDLCRKAVAIDPVSDVAVGTLAQFCMQQNQSREAIELFERNAALSRNRAELIQSITFAEAAKAQFRIATERPIVRDRLEILSRFKP